MRLLFCAAFAATATIAVAQTSSPSTALATPPGFTVKAIDKTVSPCDDFYQYACGAWLKSNPVPGDQAMWGRFTELHERNQTILRDILAKNAASGTASASDKQIGTFYGSCMDEKTVDQKGADPLKPEIGTIGNLKDVPALTAEVARLQRMGVNAIFGIGSIQDFKDSTKQIAQIDQGGLGLPEKDYYFKTDPKSQDLRKKYVEHVQKIFQLLGEPAEKATADAQTVMRIETELAKNSQDITARREPANVYHLMTREEVAALATTWDWKAYFPAVRADVSSLNVASPDFFKGLGSMLSSVSIDDWKTYLVWHYAHANARWLSKPFVDENFDFFAKTLLGQKEQRERWKRCVALVDADFGEALGKAYVDRTFGVEGKERTLRMVENIEKAMEQDINSVEWMTPETRKKALEKLHAVANKIGYPDKWRDYSSIKVTEGDLIGNDLRASEFEFDRQMAKIGKPIDKLEWQMTPPTINAYYDPQMNNINFPAGILQPPFYDNKIDDAVNYGAIGAVIGHELTHGFDDQGRQFDATGNFTDWWQKKDADAYVERAKCIEDQYSVFVADDDVKLNGKLTAGENIADNGGLRVAYMAFVNLMRGKPMTEIDGFTPEQRFFLGFAQVWCTNSTSQVKRLLAQSDPHSLPEYRVNGVVSNMPEFQKAFGCKLGQPMTQKKPCRVW